MPHLSLDKLDQEELFQLACTASVADDPASSMIYLKEAVGRPDASAKAHYLLGAEYAQIRLYERALESMQMALALDPALSVARLQLGLLWLINGNVGHAEAVLAPLAQLDPSDALRLFGEGLVHLGRDRNDAAVRCLAQGIALNTSIAPLNADMGHILDALERAGASNKPATAPAHDTPASDAGGFQHVLLAAYTGNTSH